MGSQPRRPATGLCAGRGRIWIGRERQQPSLQLRIESALGHTALSPLTRSASRHVALSVTSCWLSSHGMVRAALAILRVWRLAGFLFGFRHAVRVADCPGINSLSFQFNAKRPSEIAYGLSSQFWVCLSRPAKDLQKGVASYLRCHRTCRNKITMCRYKAPRQMFDAFKHFSRSRGGIDRSSAFFSRRNELRDWRTEATCGSGVTDRCARQPRAHTPPTA